MKTKVVLTLSLLASATTLQAAITVTFSEGASSDEINYTVAGSDVWTGGAIGARTNSETLLPRSDEAIPDWRITDSSPWNSVTPFLADIGTVSLNPSSTFEMFVNGTLIGLQSGGTVGASDLSIDGDAPGDFSLRLASLFWEYPALSGGEVISWSGSGSFDVPGGLAANMSPGNFSYSDGGGITFQAIVIPEPSSTLLLALAGLGVLRRRRS